MGPKPAEHARSHRLAISADCIFDGYRRHNSAVILIDRGVFQCIARVIRVRVTCQPKLCRPGRCLRLASSTRKPTVAAAFFSLISQRRTRCAPLLEHIAGTAPQAAYLL